MSSITILQEHDKFTYFVDTAQSFTANDTIYRVKGMNAQKTYSIAKDIVFLSGYARDLDIILSILPSMVGTNGHVNADELQTFLRQRFLPIDDVNSKRVNGLVILSIVNGKTLMVAMKQSFEHFKIISSGPPISGIDIHTDGFDNVKIGDAILERNKKNIETTGKSFIDMDIFDTYKELYTEGVGGEIRMYLFDTSGVELLRTEKLEETGLRYLDKGINVLPTGELITVHFLNGGTPITSINISSQNVASATSANKATNADYATNAGNATSANYASSAGSASSASYATNANKAVDADYAYYLIARNNTRGAYISINYNYIPDSSGMNIGSGQNPWAGGYGVSGWATTSDERLKEEVELLEDDERWLRFAKMIAPYTFKMVQGTSGRKHIGFIAQRIEEAMIECGISDMEFAGLVKAPVYADRLKDEDGNELPDYDTSSEIVDYTYHLRYEEFIPLLFLWLGSLSYN